MQRSWFFLPTLILLCTVHCADAQDPGAMLLASNQSPSQSSLLLTLQERDIAASASLRPHDVRRQGGLKLDTRAHEKTFSSGSALLRGLEQDTKSLLLTPWFPGRGALGVKVEMAW